MRKRHALLIAFHFPPSRGSGVYRTLNWANRLAAAGWQVTVVTVDTDWFHNAVGAVDESLLALVDPSVRIIRAPLWHESSVSRVEQMSRFHANFYEAHARANEVIPRWFFPEHYGLWYPAAALAGLRAGLRHRPDIVLSTGNPYASHAAARAIARLLRTRYALDYHDAWTLNQVTGEESFEPQDRAWAWERRLMRGAHLVYTVNEPLAAWYRQRYPAVADRVRVVENGWAPEVLGELPAPRARTEGPVRFGYVGTLRHDLPLEPFFEAWQGIRASGPAKDATLDLFGYLGYFARNANRLNAKLPLDRDGVAYRGPVAQRALAEAYRDIDVLVSLLPSSPYVTSGKVYDYLASARPVVAVHTPETGATAIGKDYPLWFGVEDLTPAAIARALEAAAQAARTLDPATVARAQQVGASMTWAAQIDPAVEELSRG